MKPHPVRSASLIFTLTLLLFLPSLLYAAEVTEQDLRDAITGRRTFAQEELNAMDAKGNGDGQVDVADLVVLLNPESKKQSATIHAREGDGVVLVKFYLPSVFSGNIPYTVSGTATSGQDFETLTGSVTVSGSSFEVLLTIKDDVEIEDLETVSIAMDISAGDPLVLGPPQQRTTYIEDNDAIWSGTLTIDTLSNGFELSIVQNGDFCSGVLNSDGVGGIPTGEWPVAVESDTEHFRCTLGPIDVPAELTLFKAAIKRTITLESKPAVHPGDILDYSNTITGTLKEEVSVGDNKSYLNLKGNKAISGNFVLVKRISMLPEGESEGELEPADTNN